MRDRAARRLDLWRHLILLLGSALLIGAACGGDGSKGGTVSPGNLCVVTVDEIFFTYCGEYAGYSASLCAQSMGMFNAQCPSGYAGYCASAGNVNPRRAYFYGAAINQQLVQSVCPGGKYVPGSVPGAGG